MKLKKNIWKIVLLLLAVLAVAAIAHNIIKNKKVVSQNPIKNVSVTHAKVTSLSTTVDYSGKLVADKEVSISPKTPGKIMTLNVKVGSNVKKGDILFTIDSSSLEAQLEQQQASIDSAKANLDKTRSSGFEQQVIQAEQSIKTAKINYDDAKTNYDRSQKLYSAGALSKQELDSAKTKLDSATAALSAAEQNLNLIQQKIGPESVEVAQAQVNQSEAGLKSIQSQISDNIIRSPISGTVSSSAVHEGEISPTGQPSLTIIDSSSIMAEISVPDNILSKIKKGQSLPITIPSMPDKKFTATVDTISPDADSKTKQYTVKIKLNNNDGNLKSGMFAKISLPDETKNNILAVPNQSIKVENGVSYLYIVKDNKIKKVSINTGLSNDKITEVISSKTSVDDAIVSQGQTFLNDGDKVRILN
ncbi:MAG: efflux RND transporter periplasmic adaptor subunit [Clostridium sp.]|jgi:multidrug efflux pump subunit AcrA (membrane-fusion protein)|uniref:efflux RND transporter periplasmic adaptor subunit n=1 Tax=Clostridium sp. TaxID=1506 RepID=UPI0025C43B24|nr:efflux RND transporter periplasmic adaptor subunit [Clostridium sp.]MCH3963806.1 efflux RND transporter periplasmic adaptor subunit [Clostridium sp.]MCI1716925.1 efflux RND transporter periplasmic adaptor subunit [Clostridium sp.]MCI1801356.1 efflux RND transporter periplasmic adaptor subunit [Clostridium sp.]MCI1815202.1 efflux RND transporter periplasmic adaptor subunit [Clostridium sp.]MCI1872014.1 efflux RND transporter periplasmic adaptor subunit [Clostridium sp.]